MKKRIALAAVCLTGALMLTGCEELLETLTSKASEVISGVEEFTAYTFTKFQDEVAKRNVQDHEYTTATMTYKRTQGDEEQSREVHYVWEDMKLKVAEGGQAGDDIYLMTMSTGYLKSFLNKINTEKTSSRYKYYIRGQEYKMTYKYDKSSEEYKIEGEYYFDELFCLTSGALYYTNRSDLTMTTYSFTLTHSK